MRTSEITSQFNASGWLVISFVRIAPGGFAAGAAAESWQQSVFNLCLIGGS
jgi:hypothetical protein